MGAGAGDPQAVESRQADRGGEVAVRAAAGRALAEFQANRPGDGPGPSEEAGDLLGPLHRRPVEAAVDGQAGSRQVGAGLADRVLDHRGLFEGRGADIHAGRCAGRHHVRGRPAFDHADIHRDAGLVIGQGVEVEDLVGEFLDGADALSWLDPRMSRLPLDLDHEMANTLPRRLERAVGQWWFKDKNVLADMPGGLLDQPSRDVGLPISSSDVIKHRGWVSGGFHPRLFEVRRSRIRPRSRLAFMSNTPGPNALPAFDSKRHRLSGSRAARPYRNGPGPAPASAIRALDSKNRDNGHGRRRPALAMISILATDRMESPGERLTREGIETWFVAAG